MVLRIPILDSSLNRDMKSRAIIETDLRKAEEYKTKSMMMNTAKSAHSEINMIKEKLNEIDNLKNDMMEIKALLKSIVNKE